MPKKYTQLPALSGRQLMELLQKDGWKSHGQARHGVTLKKHVRDRTIVTFIPDTNASLPDGTLAAILGVKQTGIGKNGLLDLVNRFGL
jgi:predicted RNA binding protein YcfA (HicA-like mRNA interferase family)